ncbi:DoxX family protein [Granulicoccus sp. GXG6511]|uniref:DoxX family protein n=1 Tax=Granulicoccus sp. GXG6511 TaxID=3381351 RepID=UPI003D7ED530
MSGFLKVLQDLALLIARVAFGAVLVFRGWRRWTSDGGMQGQIDYLRQFNTPAPELLAWGGTLLEMIGGVFLIFGLLTPLVALAVVVQQGMIIAWTKWFRGPWLENGGYEYNGIQAALALLFTVFGAGRLAIDRLFRRSKDNDPLLDDDFGTTRGGATRDDSGPA